MLMDLGEYESGEDLDRAILYFTRAIEVNPNEAQAYLSRGFNKYENGEYKDAFEDIDKSIELSAEYKDYFDSEYAYYLRAQAKEKLGDLEGAIEDYEVISENDGGLYCDPEAEIERLTKQLEEQNNLNK